MLFILTALSCEAEPLIDHLGLREKRRIGSYLIFSGDAIALAVSGVGKLNAAAAMGLLFGLFPVERPICLNVGIVGHRHCEVGSTFLIHKITDSETKESFYPFFMQRPVCKTSALMTVAKPEKIFGEDLLYDMEAFGFFAACSKFTGHESIHCFKVVSDNAESKNVNKQLVKNLIGNNLTSIEQCLLDLKSLETNGKLDLNAFLSRWHFTETQKCQLNRLVQRWHALESPVWDAELEKCKSGAFVLKYLEQKINSTPLKF